MRKLDPIGLTIKSFVIDNSYEYVTKCSPGEYGRWAVDGFVVLARGSGVNAEETWQDEVAPFCFCDMGFGLCESFSNYIGIIKVGQPIPEWMQDAIDSPSHGRW